MSGNEEMVQCPYDYSHIILKHRMGRHIKKCRKNQCPQTAEKFTTCPFNSTHDVPETELQYHVKTCPDRKNWENYVYIIGDVKPPDVTPHVEVPVSSENWDEDETPGISYLDVMDKRLENEMVFRQPVGLTKSQKKAFYQKEILKFARQKQKSSNATTSMGKDDDDVRGAE